MTGQPETGSNIFITFDVTNLTVSEVGLPPSLVIEASRPFQVAVDFGFSGMLAAWICSWGINCNVQVSAESIGVGPEMVLGNIVITTNGGVNYTGTVSVPAGTLTAGTYRLLGTVTIAGSPIAGYFEGPILQII